MSYYKANNALMENTLVYYTQFKFKSQIQV